MTMGKCDYVVGNWRMPVPDGEPVRVQRREPLKQQSRVASSITPGADATGLAVAHSESLSCRHGRALHYQVAANGGPTRSSDHVRLIEGAAAGYVDVRPTLEILRDGSQSFLPTKPVDGWIRSPVLARLFRLTQMVGVAGHPRYRLEVKYQQTLPADWPHSDRRRILVSTFFSGVCAARNERVAHPPTPPSRLSTTLGTLFLTTRIPPRRISQCASDRPSPSPC